MKNTFNKLYKNLGLNFYTTTKQLKTTLLVLLLVFAVFSIKAQTVTIQNATASGCYYYSGASKTTISVQVGWTGANNGNIITVTLDGTSTRTIKPQSFYDPGSGSAVAGPIVTPQVIAFEINADGNSHSLVAVLSNGASATSGTVNVTAPSPCTPMICTGTNLGGMTYYDNNANGVHDGGEIKGIPNVTVTATDKNGTTYTALSNSEGKYAFSAANSNAISAINYPVRVEFSNWPGLVQGYAGPSLSGNKSNVRFLNAAACNIDCGGVNPLSYSQSVPPVFSNLYTNGNPLGGGSAGTTKAIIQHAYNSYTDRSVTTIATSAQVGSVWAHAWNKYKNRLFSAAFVKRHVGLGPLGLGGIYTVDYSNPASPVVSNFINVATIGINVGTIASNSARGLGANKLDPNADAAAFAQVGKLGIGGMDLSDDGNTLYIMNLFDKKVYAIDITNYLASGTLPTALNVTSFTVPDPGCTGGSYRPFALKVYENKLYAGIVCDASTGTKSNLTASIKGLDLATNVWSDVFNFPLTYPKGYPSAGKPEITGWYPWTDNISTPFQNNDLILWPTPMLTDIEFDLDGAMTIALMDRIGHQMGNYNWDNASYNDGAQTDAGGDVLRAFYSNGAYVLENNAKAGPTTGYAPGNNQGPGFGEFYHDDFDAVGGYHTEMATGGLTVKPGSGEIMIGMVDPSKFRGGDIWANGVRINSSLTGDPIEGKSYYSDAGIASFGKANGMGDVEIASDNISFLEVGNYAWKDLDTDGIQDPAETGVSGVVLRMYKASDGSQVATSTTDANGNYYFSTLNGQTILPNTNYKILAGVGQFSITDTTILVNGVKYKITLTNIGQGANTTLNDNNFSTTSLSTALGSIPAGIPFFNITTGNAGYVNHSIDLGLYALPGLGDTAWNDLNKNGLQDVGETPFQSLKVYLLNASGTKIDSTTTNSSGYYQFINLQPGVYYQVQFTSPGSTFTPTLQNVGADDNDDSDIDALLKTQQVTLTWNEFNKTLDAGFYACTKPNAGSNLTACGGSCVNITGTTPTSGLWAAMGTNPAGATLGTTTAGIANVCFTNASTGTYNFIYFTGGCSDTMNIVVATKPNAGSDKLVCINTTATMNASGSGSWTAQVGNPASATITTPSSATSTITGLSVVGTYNFIWIVGSCTDTVSIVVNALPTVSAGSPFTKTCTANTSGATIGEANDATATYSWSPALGLSSTSVSNPTANPSSTTTYTVTKTNTTTGCSATANVLVTVNNTAITVSAGSPFTKTCVSNTSGATIGESNEVGNTYSWSPALGLSSTTVSNPTANPTATTTYTVVKTNTTTGCTASASVTVTVNNAAISVSAGSAFTKTCTANTSGATIGEANDATATYSWSPAAGLSSTTVSNPTANPSVTTTYTVTKTNTTTGCTATASVLVTVNNTAITVSAGSPFTKTCTSNTSGATIGEANDATATYSWSPAAGLSSTTVSNPTANPSSTTTYTVTKTNTSSGCTVTANVLVTVNNTAITVSAGSPFTKTCTANTSGATIGEANDATATYSWSPAAGLSSTTVSNPTANPTATTTYTVVKTNTSTGCTASASVTVTVNNAAISVSAGSPFTKTCTSNTSGAMIGEVNDATATYSWSPALGLSSTTVSNPTANPSATTTYTVTKTNTTTGCTATASVLVTVNNTAITVSAGSPFTKTCTSNTSGATIGEVNDATATYSWSPALGLSSTTVSNPTANPSATTTYTVTKTNTTTGCTATASVLVTVNNSAISVSAGSPFTKTCTANTSGATIGEANDATATYSWSPAAGLSSTTVSNPTANPSSTTTYTVTKTNTTSGCTATANVLVTVNNSAISVSAGSAFTKTCTSNTSGATIGEANVATATYSWSPALGLSSTTVSNPTANPSSTTTYTVTKTNTATGCTATAQVTVTVNNSAISVSAGSAFTKTCTSNTSGATIGESNDATATYSWSPALGLSSTSVSNPTANPSVTTTYTVTKTNTTTGCTATASVLVTVNNTAITVSAGSPFTKTCTTNTSGAMIGEANIVGNTYSWSPALGLSSATVSNPTANPSTTTTYTVTKTNTTTGCTATASVLVTVNNTAISVSAGSPFTKTCVSNISGATIGESNDATATYSWSPALGLSSTSVSNPTANPSSITTYTVTKTNTTSGCTATAQVTVTVNNTAISVNAGSSFTKTCVANTSGATIGESNDATATYSWSPALGLSSTTVSNPTANPSSTTTYTVTKTNTTSGCTATASVLVTVNNTAITVSAGSPFTKTCTSNTSGATIGESNDATATYSWSPATGLSSATVSNPTANPSSTTTYTVTKTNTTTGCSATASVLVTVNNTAITVSAGSPFTKTCTANTSGATIGEANDATATYSWSPSTGLSSATVSNPTANPSSTTTYTVTKTNTTSGCTATAQVTVTVNTTLPIVSAGSSVCVGNNMNLTPATGGTWTSSNNSIASVTNSGLVAGINAGNVNFTFTNSSNGCSATTTNVAVNANATSTTTANICLTAMPYVWNSNTYTTAGTYLVHLTNSKGCDSAATLILNVVNASVGNYVWNDLNSNGIQDEPTSAGLNGVSVELYKETTTGNFTLVGSTVTANIAGNPGYYNFTICNDGNYKVKFPTTNGGNGLTNQTSTAGTDGNNDADVVSGFSPVFTINTNGSGVAKNNPTMDAGYVVCSKPNAGADIYTCNGASSMLMGTSPNSGTWSAMAGNPVGATLGISILGESALNFASNSTGTFAFIYTVSGGCADTVNVIVGNPIANFTYTKNCKNEVTFTNTSTNATDYEWIIGDRTICTTSTIPNQTLYSDNESSGTSYIVSLIAKNNSLCYDTMTQMITIYPPAITVFSATPIGCTTKVKFNNFTMFGNSYTWDFGVIGSTTDTSTQTNPTYTYPSNGTYTVSLIANNSEGCGDTLTKTVVVNSNGISPTANFTISEITNGCAKRYSFTNTSTNAVSYQWIFADGSTVNTVNASKSFANAGTYAVKLVAESSTGCFDTIVQNVNVIGNSIGTVASFNVNNPKQCLANNSFEFYNTSVFVGSGLLSGWIPTYYWDFGDGTYDNVNSSVFNKHYTTPGIYTIRVIAVGTNGCRDTAYQTIEILPSPIASFTANTSCGMTALINNQTTGAITNIWNFGTGYFEENNNATFTNTYHHEDWYYINLIAIGANGCTDRTDRGVFPTRVGAPVPNFTYDTLGCSRAIRFTNTSIGGASASWNFGDGSPLNTNFDPTHIYATAGNYTVTLTLSNGPFCSATYSVLVHAPQGYNVAAPKAGMTLSVGTCTNTINAVDTSLNNFIRNWYFDGFLVGVLPTISLTNPTIGGHELKLTVSNGVCFDTLKQFVLIQGVPISVATHQISSCSRTVVFSSQATSGNTYNWNFNDAGSSQNTSEGSLVSHTFSSNGTYYVSLTSTNLSGCSTSTIDTVVVNAGNNPLNAAFKFNSNTCNCVCNNKIQFTNLSSGTGNTYLWNFGDGTSTTQTNPNKGFANAGVYNVTLTAISPTGCISVASMQVSILPNAKGPSASFNTDNQVQCLSGNNFSFHNTSKHMGSGWNMKYYWNFGDGTIDTMNTFVYNKHYAAVGVYTVTLVALGSDNCFDTMTMTVQVKNTNCLIYSNNVQLFTQNNSTIFAASGNTNTGVTEQINENNSWNLYPNPNIGTFNVACKKLTSNVEIEVIDILGRKVNANITKNYGENKVEISCTNISTGNYFVLITNGKDGEITRLKFNITQ